VTEAEGPVEKHSLTQDEGVLHRFLADHSRELVGLAR
jgi:hypothetical protein